MIASRPNMNGAATRTAKINFDAAVIEGKKIVARDERDQMRLGELADKLEPKYGDRTLAKFAKAIGVAECTLKRRRTVYRAWKEIGAPAPILYSVAQELAAHPERAAIVKDNPDLTRAKARRLMREHSGNVKQKKVDDWQKDAEGWFRGIVAFANKAERLAQIVNEKLTTAQRRRLQLAIEPALLDNVFAGGKALQKLATFLRQQNKATIKNEAAAKVIAVSKVAKVQPVAVAA